MGEKELRQLVAENLVERVEPDSDTALQESAPASWRVRNDAMT